MSALQPRLRVRPVAPWAVGLLVLMAAGLAGMQCVKNPADETHGVNVFVSDQSETVMQPLDVTPPQQERWRDIADVAYRDDWREDFDYADRDAHRAEVRYETVADAVRGRVTARGLKPSFAYQLKLVGLEPLLGPNEADNVGNARAWSSWQLGRLGRWWCEDCGWNVSDADLASHVGEGHAVHGYLLFDWLVTDEDGDAEHAFALSSSLHVLWRVGQRERGPNDTPPRWYTVERPGGVYPVSAANTKQQIGLFGEWEPDRPRIGEARLAPGAYHVGMNLTEESFHANMDEKRALEGGGFWAWVLQSELQFEVR